MLNDPCENGGTCTELDGITADCACAEGYTGSQCETRKKRSVVNDHLFTFSNVARHELHVLAVYGHEIFEHFFSINVFVMSFVLV